MAFVVGNQREIYVIIWHLFFFLKVRPNKNFVQIFSFTQADWLDVVEIEFQPGQERGTLGKVMTARSMKLSNLIKAL